MLTIGLDLRYALRALSRSPWFTGLVVGMIALGIGSNAALFSMVDAVLLRALPFDEPHRLIEIFGEDDTRSGMRVPPPIVDALRTRSVTLEALTIHGPVLGVLQTEEGPIDVRGDHAWANFSDVLGVAPEQGRGFLAHEAEPGAAPVMLVSHGFWRRFLAADPLAVGRTLHLDSLAYTVIGVMPESFRTQFGGYGEEHFWTPYASDRVRQLELESGYELIGRLAPGVSVDLAAREMEAIAAGVGVEEWRVGGRRLGVRRLVDEVVGDSARALKLSFAAVGLMLIIVCANLALLVLARSDSRLAEFATRKAVGASATQLLRLALAESLLLSAAGGATGVTLAYWLLPLLVAWAPAEIPRLAEAAIDARVLILATFLTVCTALAFGTVPALRLTRISVMYAWRRASDKFTVTGISVRGTLVLGQVAGAVLLCILAGLVGRTFLALVPTELGFSPQSLSAFPVFMAPSHCPDPTDRYHRLAELVTRLEALPGASAAGLTQDVPFSGDDDDYMTVVRTAIDNDAHDVAAMRISVSSNYFELLSIPMLRGRAFTDKDGPSSPRVAIVNRTLARRLDATGNVLGRSIRIGGSADAPAWEIVGVAADTRSSGSTRDIQAQVYLPFVRTSPTASFVVLRSSLSNEQITAAIRKEIRAVAPAQPLPARLAARGVNDMVSESLAAPRFLATLSAAFAVTAMLLAGIGVFGIVAYTVAKRRREFGIRAALGARPRDLAFTTMSSVTALSAAGITVGLAAAAYLTRFIETQLYAIEPRDLPTFAVAAAIMLLLSLLAAAIPTQRAAAILPMSVLRED